MPSLNIRGLFRKKKGEDQEVEKTSSSPESIRKEDASMSYVHSPSALEYPDLRSKEPPEKKVPAKEYKKKAKEKGAEEAGLPRCPNCGWAIGFNDRECRNCGNVLRPGP